MPAAPVGCIDNYLWGIDEDNGHLYSIDDFVAQAGVNSTTTDWGQITITPNGGGTPVAILGEIESAALDLDDNHYYFTIHTNIAGYNLPILAYVDLDLLTTPGSTVLATVIGSVNTGGDNVEGLAMNSSGELFGVLKFTGELIKINTTTAQIEAGYPVLLSGATFDDLEGAAFDHLDNLYVVESNPGVVYIINPVTGAVISVFDNNVQYFDALAWDFENNRLLGFEDAGSGTINSNLWEVTPGNGGNILFADLGAVGIGDLEGFEVGCVPAALAPSPVACNLAIATTTSSNCTGSVALGYTAQWDISLTYSDPPSPIGNIEVYRNGTLATTITSPTASPQQATITGVPADGGAYDTLVVVFANETTCNDTVIIKRPVPCMPSLGSASGAICAAMGASDIGGTVWEDWNYNGTMDATETSGVLGVKVYLYDDCGSLQDSTYTDAYGNYVFVSPGTGPFRVEFSLPEVVACWACPTHVGPDNGSLVQFAGPGDCASLGLAEPDDYCQTTAYLAIPCYLQASSSPGNNGENVLVSFPYAGGALDNGTNGAAQFASPAPTHLATYAELGTNWGLAWARGTNTLYASSFMKRHTSFGPGGTGAIYQLTIDPSTGAIVGTPSVFINIDGQFGANSAGPISHDVTRIITQTRLPLMR
ncbi:MAG: SdrD B-like domain-containing protein [Bacteroidia bacterium]